MPLSFRADDLLQELVRAPDKVLLVRNQQVRAAIKERGEYWRISPLPSVDENDRMIGVPNRHPGDELYYYARRRHTAADL